MGTITLVDSAPVQIADVGVNFFIHEQDIAAGKSRAEVLRVRVCAVNLSFILSPPLLCLCPRVVNLFSSFRIACRISPPLLCLFLNISIHFHSSLSHLSACLSLLSFSSFFALYQTPHLIFPDVHTFTHTHSLTPNTGGAAACSRPQPDLQFLDGAAADGRTDSRAHGARDHAGAECGGGRRGDWADERAV